MAARATWAPGWSVRHGSACSSCSHAGAHERVPRGVELDLVAAVAEAVVGVQHRRVLVGLDAPAHRLAAPERAGGAAGARAPSRRPRARAPSRSAAWSSKRLRPSSGGTWLRTSWVAVGRGEHQCGLLGDGAQAEGDEVGDERVGVDVVRDRRERADERLAQRADEGGGGELDVLGRAARRRRRPSRRTSLEAGGVGAAEGQALDLDGGVDGLGQQRPGQAPAAQRAAREGLDRGGEPRGTPAPPAASAAARVASTSRCEARRKTSAKRSALDGKWR